MSALVDAAPTGLGAAVDRISERAAALDDASVDIRDDLAALGAAGLLRLGLDRAGLPDMVAVIEEISAASLAAGFCVWAHRMALHYLHLAPPSLRDAHFEAVAHGEQVGVTAMAAGLKHVAGLGELPVIAESDGAGLRVSGPIRWASNVFADALIVLPARTERGDTYVVVADADADGVTINPAPRLMALNATGSTSLRLHEVVVPKDRIVSTDLRGFVAQIRPTFLLLQTAFCVGVGAAALRGAHQLHDGAGAGAQFGAALDALTQAAKHHRENLYRWAADPAAAALSDLIRLRLQTATLAVDATRLEVTLTGGAGYALGNAANRRFRESAFLPIQSPSEGQLRWELTQYE
jgi:alkylation response protein AidB-like acyl-CoA dehydrogenase